ncbi:MAG: SRPBCC family protein, partial [Candidatus Obscuribacterales bacterium]|nr:SRPBCC family protein [Candidatus Obscuribacterales bacterium]
KSGLIEAGQSVTWKARHLGIWFSLKSQISAYDRPNHFRDSMQEGPFSRFVHDHFFEFKNLRTRMVDRLDYESPFGPIGNIADRLFLKNYLKDLLLKRNEQIKTAAESNPQAFLS